MGTKNDPVHVAVGLSEVDETCYFHEANPGETEGSSGVFEADVPAALWARWERGWRVMRRVGELLREACGMDPEAHRLARPCGSWVGDEPRPFPGWSWVSVPPSGDPNVWPAGTRDHHLRQFATEGEARAWIGTLPDTFYVLPYEAVLVERDALVVSTVPGWTSRAHQCDRCGWERDEHTTRLASVPNGETW